MDVDARLQLFDLKTKYQFQTQPGVDKYNMPLYSVQTQPGAQTIGMYPVYQGFTEPCFINGFPTSIQTQKKLFYNAWPHWIQNLGQVATGDGTEGPYTIQLPILSGTAPLVPPYNSILRGHIDMAGIIAIGNTTGQNQDPPLTADPEAAAMIPLAPVTSVESAFYLTSIGANGQNVVVADSGWFLSDNINCGLLMTPGNAPFGNTPLTGGYSDTSNVINYLTGQAYVTFPVPIPSGNIIQSQCYFYASGLPRAILYYNNCITLRSPPSTQYLVELDAYLTPAAFLDTTAAIPFGYMAEYIARGAARKILSDTGDVEQFQFYEPLFLEQEQLVWKRSQRQWTTTRTETIYSLGPSGNNNGFYNSYGANL
jgi:hypothetical protein